MAAPVSSIYDVLECVKYDVKKLCRDEKVSELLVWLMLRQQADYELLLLQESNN